MNKAQIRRLTAILCTLFLLLGALPSACAAPETDAYALVTGATGVPDAPDVLYAVASGGTVALNPDDFRSFFYAHCQNDTFRYVTFQPDTSLKASNGVLYHSYQTEYEVALTRNALSQFRFYDRSNLYGSYPIEGLSFVANRQAESGAVNMTFTAAGDSETCEGKLRIAVQSAPVIAAPGSSAVVDLTWHVTAGEKLPFERKDFFAFFKDRASSDDSFRYLTFQPDSSYNADNGSIYYDFEGKNQKQFSSDMLKDTDFYYSSSRYGAYPISGMTFVAANEGGGNLVRLPFSVFGRTERYSGTLVIQIDWAKSGGVAPAPPSYGPPAPSNADQTPATSTDAPAVETPADNASANVPANPDTSANTPANDDTPSNPETPADNQAPEITYTVRAGERAAFRVSDFSALAKEKLKGTFRYVTFNARDTLSAESGLICADVGGVEEVTFTNSTVDDYRFYAESDRYGDYALNSVYFMAPANAPAHTVLVECTLHSSTAPTAMILMSIQVQAADAVDTGDTVAPAPADSGNTAAPVPADSGDTVASRPTDSGNTAAPIPADSGDTVAPRPTDNGNTAEPAPADGGDTVAPAPTNTPTDTTEPGAPVNPEKPEPLNITEPFNGTPVPGGNILYATTWNAPLRLVSDDFDRFFRKVFPGGTFSHAAITTLPQNGRMFYDYYASSPFGDVDKLELMTENLSYMNFYFSPAYNDRYSLAELTYIPGAEKNICDTLSFAATGLDSDGNIVQCTGDVLISVTKALITDVYGAIPKGRTVTFPASNLESNVKDGTGANMNGFRFLQFPDVSIGSIIFGEDGQVSDSAQIYHWTNIEPKISALRFVPAPDYTGSVDIPYLVVDSDGNGVGIGHFTLGVISTLKRFKDVTADVWCYKYVTELAADGVIGGYGDDTYRPNISVTWGAALKLIMLAAGYDEQPGSSITPFQGYLDKAIEDHLLPREVDLWEPVTRLEVAELTAAAMKLDTVHLSSVQPFSDTDNPSVQALNAAGIINGYYNEGESTFRPGGTLNRGQVSAIVWRMRNYQA